MWRKRSNAAKAFSVKAWARGKGRGEGAVLIGTASPRGGPTCASSCQPHDAADTLTEMQQDVQSSISYSGGKKLMDIRKVNYVILGGDNQGEHLLM